MPKQKAMIETSTSTPIRRPKACTVSSCKKINKSHTHTTENNTPDNDTHTRTRREQHPKRTPPTTTYQRSNACTVSSCTRDLRSHAHTPNKHIDRDEHRHRHTLNRQTDTHHQHAHLPAECVHRQLLYTRRIQGKTNRGFRRNPG